MTRCGVRRSGWSRMSEREGERAAVAAKGPDPDGRMLLVLRRDCLLFGGKGTRYGGSTCSGSTAPSEDDMCDCQDHADRSTGANGERGPGWLPDAGFGPS